MPRILIVDDELQVRRVVGLAFELEGFEVATAADGADGIAQVQLFHPDVVIMDIMMPRVDGLTALSHLRQQPGSADVPVLLLSAKADSADIAIGMRAGADDYVTKPFDLEDLLARATAAAAAGHRPAPVTHRPPAPAAVATSLVERPAAPRTVSRVSERTTTPSAVMAGVAAFALLTLVIVAVGMALAWAGSPPPLWTGVVLEVPALMVGAAVARHSMRTGGRRVELRGTGLGGRTITACACVCRSPADASGRLLPGDILVIEDPAPTYNAVGSLLAGLVVESGGLSSHAAILARQLGIPALVGATGACTLIRNGDRITIDPVAGTVTSR